MSNRVLLFLSALVVLSVAGGCSRKDDGTPCVATPTVSLARDRAAIGSPIRMTYRFDVAQKIPQDYWVFVHVLDDQGETLWGDDHLPAAATSTWQPGQKVEYTRTVFVPNFPYIGAAHVRVGMYQPSASQRLPLCATDVARREYEVAKFQLLPQSENIFLLYKDGWHTPEVSSASRTEEWQWTKKTATISFRNPKRDATFYLEYDARSDVMTPPQQVTVRAGDQVVATFAADTKGPKLATIPLSAAALGTGDMSELTIEVDRTFTPGGSDTRELGIRVFHAFVEPK